MIDQAVIEQFLAGFKADVAKLTADELVRIMPDPERLLTADEAAARLNISARHLRSLAGEGKVATVQLSENTLRYRNADIDEFILARRRVAPRAEA